MIQRNGRTQINLHAEGNSMLTENERDIAGGSSARSLVGQRGDVRGSVTVNRQILGNVSATLNTELEHVSGKSLIGPGENTSTCLHGEPTAISRTPASRSTGTRRNGVGT